jgi:hypothetical protein
VITRHISGMILAAAMAACVPACFADSILYNGSFELGSSEVVSHTGGPSGGPSAADGWNIWNNDPGAATITELCTAADCSGRTPYGEAPLSLPPAPLDGLHTLHIVTTATVHNNGIYTTFAPVDSVTLDSLWVYVVSGVVAQGVGNGGATQLDLANESVVLPGQWQHLTSLSTSGVANEMIAYATEAGTPADFYLDAASVTAYSAAPEPASVALIFGAALFLVPTVLRRSRNKE